MESEGYDYLICLSIENTEESIENSPHRFLYIDRSKEIAPSSVNFRAFPSIIEFDWCAYDLNSQLVTEELNTFVRPPQLSTLTEAVQKRTGVKVSDCSTAKSLSDIITKNKSFTFATFGDWILAHQLRIECALQGIKLPAYFHTFLNIHRCFTESYPGSYSISTVSGVMQMLQLKERKLELTCLSEYQSIVRIINKLAKDGYRFRPAKSSICQPVKEVSESLSIQTDAIQRSRSRERNIEYTWTKLHEAYVRLTNLPWDCTVGDIKEFMQGILIKPSDIAVAHNVEGQFLKEAIVRLTNYMDLPIALGYSGRILKKQCVEVTEANEKDFNEAKASPKLGRIVVDPLSSYMGPGPADLAAIRMRGLPFDVTEKDIFDFFAPYSLAPGSIKIGLNTAGQRTGEAVVLFPNQETAKRAVLEKHGDNIGHRWIELYLIKTSQYYSFELSQERKISTTSIGKYLTKENKGKTLKLRGLPFNVTEEDILEFFKNYNIKSSGIIIERENGKATGNALVFMGSRGEALSAREDLHLKYIGKRYIEVLACDDNQ